MNVLALTPLPGARRTLGQGLTTDQLEALAYAVRAVVARPVLLLHRPCHVEYAPCQMIPATEPGRVHYGPQTCMCCREGWPCATVTALDPGPAS